MNFLGNLFLHGSNGLLVRILASGAGGLGSNPGQVSCGREMEWLWKLYGYVWGVTEFLNYLHSKMQFEFIEISKIIVEI